MKVQKPTFEEAINFSMVWCNAWQDGELSDEVLADKIGELLKTSQGARGFLAIGLASDCPLMDRLPDSIIFQLRAAGDLIVDLVARNLAMSTAMSINHIRNKDDSQRDSSLRVSDRCIELLKVLDPNKVKIRLETLIDGIESKGPDVDFLKKWGYDKEQKIAIASKVNSIGGKNYKGG
tara:strand:- start:580 stop:1113 length:534 start_codon:yes stop_codon:yes gene_type:complete